MSVLKAVGRGILYVIALPFFLLLLALVGIAGLFLIIFMFVKSIILFFTGRSLDDDLPEDVKANEIKEGRSHTIIQTIPDEDDVNDDVKTETINQNPVPPRQDSTIEQAVFGDDFIPEEPKETVQPPVEEKPVEQPKPVEEDKPIIEETKIDSHVDEIDVGSQYTPKTGSDRFFSLNEEEEEDSGVTITYDEDDDD